MKSGTRLSFKIIICYALAIIIIVFGWSIGGTYIIKNRIIDNDSTRIYKELNTLADNYADGFYKNSLSSQELYSHLMLISEYLDVRILTVRKDGIVISDTDISSAITADLYSYDTDILSSSISNKVTLPGLIDKPFISISLPIYYNMNLRGYFVAIKYHDTIYQEADQINVAYWPFIAIIITLLSIGCFVLFRLILVPLKRTIQAAKEYSNHNYDYNYKTPYNDEFRELQNILTYMVNNLNAHEDDQKAFISNISHDFRSPLTSVKGYTEAMIDGTIPPELHEKYLEIILFETKRLTKLTENLLSLNNMEHSGSKLDITEFDINTIIKQTAASFEGTCTGKKITLRLVFDEPKTLVSADMSKIQQVLYNLTDNAIKFSHESSVIRIATKVTNDKVFVSVKDNGIGIPKDSLNKIWDRFYKTDLSRGKDKKGTGLGLSIVKEIITAHGENINVTSTVDVGTEFTFSLKCAEESE